MKEVSIIGVDLAKNVFHLHGSAAGGSVVFRKKFSRLQFERFMAAHPACTIALEACGGAHHYEFGYTAPIRIHQIRRLAEIAEDDDSGLPEVVRLCCREILAQIAQLGGRLRLLDREIARLSGERETARRLMTMPGVGPVTALAVETFAPAMVSFRKGRDFAARLGLVPLQKSTGGKQRLGKASKMGQRDIRRLLIIGAMSTLQRTLRKGAAQGSWLERMLAKKPRMLVAIALANKMARGIWAMMTKNEDYRGRLCCANCLTAELTLLPDQPIPRPL